MIRLTVLVYFTCLVGNRLAQFASETVETNYGKVLVYTATCSIGVSHMSRIGRIM